MSVSRTDVFGAALSSTDDASIEAFNRAAGLLLAYDPDPLEVLDAAIVDDSGFIMGRCLRAGIHLIASDQRYQPRMLEDLEVLRSIAVRANDRELRHIEALSCWAQGDRAAASVVYADLLLEYPRDLCALQIGHQIDFLLGTAGLMRDRPALGPGGSALSLCAGHARLWPGGSQSLRRSRAHGASLSGTQSAGYVGNSRAGALPGDAGAHGRGCAVPERH
jgi:hypothetical protein